MKFVLFVEGHTEKAALPQFLGRALNPHLPKPVGIQAIRFDGWRDYERRCANVATRQLHGRKAREIIALIGLLDLHGPHDVVRHTRNVTDPYAAAKAHFENIVGLDIFRQHFAVHEVEAWLLADPEIHDGRVRSALQRHARNPESVDHDAPPSTVLNRAYKARLDRDYGAHARAAREIAATYFAAERVLPPFLETALS